MRSFHPIKLINEIAENPFRTIGQHNYSLMKAYLMPWRIFTKIKIDPKIEKQVENIQSIEEFVAAEFNEKHTRTVLFDYYLGWISEDERDLLKLVIDRIRKYEMTFPVPNDSYSFECKNGSELDLRNTILKSVLNRPGMYGIKDLAGVRAFLDGYFRLKSESKFLLSEYEVKLLHLIDCWKRKIKSELPFETWERVLQFEKMGTTNFTNNFSWEVERFEQILFEETKMELIAPQVIGK